MKAKRAALLGMLACLICAVASAQVAPNNQGDIGLFTIPTADQPEPGRMTLGFYGWLEQLTAADLPFQNTDLRDRVYQHAAGEFSLGFGITPHWSVFASAGGEQYRNRGGWFGGTINGIQLPAPFESNEARKVRIGTKVTFFADPIPAFRLGLWLAAHVPINNGNLTVGGVEEPGEQINSPRTDWEWGAAATKGWFTFMGSYLLAGEQNNDVRPSNLLRFALGVDIPLKPIESLHIIGEIDRNIMDGGDAPPPNYSMLNTGVRWWIGRTGWAVSTALGVNLDLLLKHGNNPAPWGGILGVTYAAFPPPPPEPVHVPPPAPVEVVEEEPAPAPAPAPTPPPPAAPRRTSDEILFDAGSARLTNIAKAMLDGIALRMKNDLNSTAVITGYSDNTGTEEANLAISGKRADAAKEYLVTRHGIDPNRISAVAKGSSEPAYDNATAEGRARNRRAVIVVTLISGA